MRNAIEHETYTSILYPNKDDLKPFMRKRVMVDFRFAFMSGILRRGTIHRYMISMSCTVGKDAPHQAYVQFDTEHVYQLIIYKDSTDPMICLVRS